MRKAKIEIEPKRIQAPKKDINSLLFVATILMAAWLKAHLLLSDPDPQPLIIRISILPQHWYNKLSTSDAHNYHLPTFDLMIFIFGYHPIARTEGPIEEKECPNCHNTRHWLLGKMTYWINLFFIPVIPTRSEYFEYCPVCNFRQEVTREDFHHKRELAHLNKEAVKQDMSEEEYNERLKNL